MSESGSVLVSTESTAYGTYAMPDPAEDEKTLDVQVAAIIAAQRTSQGAAGLAAS